MHRTEHRHPLLAGALLLFLLITLMIAPCIVRAADQQIRLNEFVLDNSEGQIAIRFGLGLGELDQLRLLLKEGGTVTLNCEATLSKPSSLWLDSTLTQQGLTSTLSYNVLTREYILTISNRTELFKHNSLPKLLSDTWEKLTLNVGQLVNLQRDEQYRVDLQIQIEKDNVPQWLTNTLFFWSWDVAPPMHYSMDFTF